MTDTKEVNTYEEINISCKSLDESDNRFAQIIGCIEEIIVDENFTNLQTAFLDEYWKEFDNEEENKLIYTEIFKKYISTIEKFIEEKLIRSIKDFNMIHFEEELQNKKNELSGEIFEILTTFSDFQSFKNMFLDYKAMKEGKMMDFSQAMLISKYHLNAGNPYEDMM